MTAFSINGRFLAQKATGVQRYALEVTKAIDVLLGSEFKHLTGQIIVPQGTALPEFENIKGMVVGQNASQFWEQIRLPIAASGTLICLGNTGPIFYRDKIVCVHGANYKLSPGSYSRLFGAYMRTMIPLVAKTSRKIASVSHFSAHLISEAFGIPEKHVMVAYNGHEHALAWQPRHSDVATKYAISPRYLLLVGSLSRHKNWSLIAQIAADLDAMGLQIVAVGSGGAEFTEIQQEGLNRFLMLGRVSDDDLAWLYQNAQMMLFPSLIEGFGLPLVEAMAHDCPIVSSDTSCMPEVAGSAAILLDPLSPDDWLATIRDLYAHPERLDAMRMAGQQQVLQFSWTQSARAYLRAVEDRIR